MGPTCYHTAFFKITPKALTVVPFSVLDFEVFELDIRLHAKTCIACKPFAAECALNSTSWAPVEIVEEVADYIRSQTVKGDGRVVVVIGLAEGDGG